MKSGIDKLRPYLTRRYYGGKGGFCFVIKGMGDVAVGDQSDFNFTYFLKNNIICFIGFLFNKRRFILIYLVKFTHL